VATVQAGDNLGDQLWFGFIGMDAKGLSRQNRAPVPCLSATKGQDAWCMATISDDSILTASRTETKVSAIRHLNESWPS
jgi:hypothetical protein